MRATDLVRPFPARVPPLPGESLNSLIRRTSEVMGYESIGRVVTLLAARGRLTAHLNDLASGQAYNYLAALVYQPVERLFSLTVHHYASSLVLVPRDGAIAGVCDSKTILRYFSSSGPVCPVCLGQDEIPYERLLWSFRPIPVCVEHGCIFVCRCPSCQRPLRWDRPDVSRCRCGQRLGEIEPLTVSPHGLQLARVLNEVLLKEVRPLPEMSVPACFWWAERMAVSIMKTPNWLAEVSSRVGLQANHHGNSIAWMAAAEILTDWPRGLEAFLDVFQQVDKHKTTSTGVGRWFGTLLRHAARLEELGYAAPAVALRRYLIEHYAGGHLSGKVCLFQRPKDRAALRQRVWITQSTAAKTLGLRHGAVATLVKQQILKGHLHSAGQQGRSVGLVSRKSIETLQQELRDALSVKTTAKRLGIGRHGVLDLIHGGTLQGAVRTAQGWKIPCACVTELEDFCERLPAGRPASLRWLSLRQATRIFGPTGLTLALLIDFVRTKRFAARLADPGKRLNGIVVSPTDITAQLPEIRSRRDQSRGYPVHHLGKALFPGRPIKSSVVAKWIDAGLLKARKSGRARLVSVEEVDQFRSRYCLAEEACRLLNIARSTLSRWEVEGRTQPVYGKRVTPGAGFSLYRREDLARLSRRRAA